MLHEVAFNSPTEFVYVTNISYQMEQFFVHFKFYSMSHFHIIFCMTRKYLFAKFRDCLAVGIFDMSLIVRGKEIGRHFICQIFLLVAQFDFLCSVISACFIYNCVMTITFIRFLIDNFIIKRMDGNVHCENYLPKAAERCMMRA